MGICLFFCEKGKSNFTQWRIWLGTCQTGDAAAPTHRRKKRKKEGPGPIKNGQTGVSQMTGSCVDQSEAALGRHMCGVYQ